MRAAQSGNGHIQHLHALPNLIVLQEHTAASRILHYSRPAPPVHLFLGRFHPLVPKPPSRIESRSKQFEIKINQGARLPTRNGARPNQATLFHADQRSVAPFTDDFRGAPENVSGNEPSVGLQVQPAKPDYLSKSRPASEEKA